MVDKKKNKDRQGTGELDRRGGGSADRQASPAKQDTDTTTPQKDDQATKDDDKSGEGTAARKSGGQPKTEPRVICNDCGRRFVPVVKRTVEDVRHIYCPGCAGRFDLTAEQLAALTELATDRNDIRIKHLRRGDLRFGIMGKNGTA